MNEVVTIAPVRKIVSVKAPIAHAFEVFTSGLTHWWPHDHGVGKKPIEKVLMEPRLGGRWLGLRWVTRCGGEVGVLRLRGTIASRIVLLRSG